jgi:ABC-type nitrate/sulfonate/bicarbonate transport system substrate-binding protein
MGQQHMRIFATAHGRCARRARLFALLLFVCGGAASVEAPEQVVLQLNWKHQFQFAGYYGAVVRGYYREAGFAVAISEPGPD